ncbi:MULTISPECIES: phage holin [unclassified Bacillus (in: firmicutes)]|uniref:phage holin n=1 Tax=unclassified Bacillus (in: firmicutes) TaxID=185979 RepID=UPI0008F0D06C|nr:MULTISPECIES: phage holin [unclassified Bacillus (in: firmicutes)]SFA70357.1 holin, phage phi LC3 family [Bacillus sp. UNCCL13]SFQ60043.1 holin, phage phi LC3 family [Bacillus sp. cl95]
MINWKVRFKNGSWVIAFISQLMIVLQMVLSGLNMLDITDYQLTNHVKDTVLTFANAVFVLLSMLGIVQDPTTKGLSDSKRALDYHDPQ